MPKTRKVPEAQFVLVLDNTVLSNFAVVDQISLLEEVYCGHVFTTLMVVDEIQRGLHAGYQRLQSVEEVLNPPHPTGWLRIFLLESAEEQALYIELITSLGAGEASCLAVASARGFVLATDDLAARRAATQRNVRLTGTVGILIRLVREGHLSLAEANNILAQMIDLHYRAPVERLDDLV